MKNTKMIYIYLKIY